MEKVGGGEERIEDDSCGLKNKFGGQEEGFGETHLEHSKGSASLAHDGFKCGQLSVALEDEAYVEDKGVAVVHLLALGVLLLVHDPAERSG